MNVITKQPTEAFEGYARGGVGNGSSLGGEIAIAGPLVRHKLLFRGSALWKDSDGDREHVSEDEGRILTPTTPAACRCGGNRLRGFRSTDACPSHVRTGGAVLY